MAKILGSLGVQEVARPPWKRVWHVGKAMFRKWVTNKQYQAWLGEGVPLKKHSKGYSLRIR